MAALLFFSVTEAHAIGTVKINAESTPRLWKARSAQTLIQDNRQRWNISVVPVHPTCGTGSAVLLCGKLIWKTEGKGESGLSEPLSTPGGGTGARETSPRPHCRPLPPAPTYTPRPPEVPVGWEGAPVTALPRGYSSKAEPPRTRGSNRAPPQQAQGLLRDLLLAH